jgi:methylthioribose-1-phosphate isomerase
MSDLIPLEWRDNKLIILDQTRLPAEEIYLDIENYADVASAIKRLAVRGAPAIGVATAYGIALGALHTTGKTRAVFMNELKVIIVTFRRSRPTARNLFWAAERLQRIADEGKTVSGIKKALLDDLKHSGRWPV